jgi:hypothetical protein
LWHLEGQKTAFPGAPVHRQNFETHFFDAAVQAAGSMGGIHHFCTFSHLLSAPFSPQRNSHDVGGFLTACSPDGT